MADRLGPPAARGIHLTGVVGLIVKIDGFRDDDKLITKGGPSDEVPGLRRQPRDSKCSVKAGWLWARRPLVDSLPRGYENGRSRLGSQPGEHRHRSVGIAAAESCVINSPRPLGHWLESGAALPSKLRQPSGHLDGVRLRFHGPEGDQAIGPGAPERLRFSFGIARALGTVVVTLRGPLDAAGARVLKTVLGDLIENQGNLAVVVDVHDVTEVEPAGLDVLVLAQGWSLIRGGQLVIAGAERCVARALEMTGVARLVRVTSDRVLAVSSPRIPVPEDEQTTRRAELRR